MARHRRDRTLGAIIYKDNTTYCLVMCCDGFCRRSEALQQLSRPACSRPNDLQVNVVVFHAAITHNLSAHSERQNGPTINGAAARMEEFTEAWHGDPLPS